jgi:hypothetical protein
MLLTWIYQVILAFFSILIIYDIFKEKSRMMQLTAAIALIPFLLRLLMVK